MSYAIFHCNIDFSSIEVDQRPTVVERCYWPLLRMASRLPLGIEASGHTLEVVREIDPLWVDELRRLVTDGGCEFIGSGYAQIIGPLVPARVNERNLAEGHRVYKDLLGCTPSVALVHEMAYSRGLVPLYLDAGYEAIVMEYQNPSLHHDWIGGPFVPRMALGSDGRSIPVIWADTIQTQWVQRYAHGDDRRPAMTGAIYCGDAEVFGYRPGRYETEAPIRDDEWERVGDLLSSVADMDVPSAALSKLAKKTTIDLASTEVPIPVKKQPKYNASRWYDAALDSACWRDDSGLLSWRSDLRTHITESRRQSGCVEMVPTELGLDPKRGGAISYLEIDGKRLIGTVPHGFFDDIRLAADYYSGHTVIEVPGQRRITDLSPVDIVTSDAGAVQTLSCEVGTPLGTIAKTYVLRGCRVDLHIRFDFHQPVASFRSGIITLLPTAWHAPTLYYATHNGGRQIEVFPLHGHEVTHSEPATALVTAQSCIGATEGVIVIGDKDRSITLRLDRTACSAMPMIYHWGGLTRVLFSLGEIDDTRRRSMKGPIYFSLSIMGGTCL